MREQKDVDGCGTVPSVDLDEQGCKHELLVGGLKETMRLEPVKNPLMAGTMVAVGTLGAVCLKCARQWKVTSVNEAMMTLVPLPGKEGGIGTVEVVD